eukprot:12744203-Ditylum_brightwellii.AAC.1
MSKRVGRERGSEISQETISTATSTMAQVTKCTWFVKSTLTTHNTTTNSKRLLPKALAIDYILGKTESLHPTIKTNLIMLRTHHIELQMKTLNKANQKKRLLDDEEFIPHSAQIEFEFKVSKEAEVDQEFTNLLEVTNIIRECKKNLKTQIIKCIDIELKLLHQHLLDEFVKSFGLLQNNT